MRADQKDDLCVCMVGAGPIHSHPVLVPGTAARRANVCMRVVTVNTPRGENTFGESIFAWTAYVIHHFVIALLDNRLANASGYVVKRFVPTNANPFTFASFAGPLERVQN